jgi:acyl dehydratase
MPTRVLDRTPHILPLYARAAAPLLPGASLLPFVPGGGGEIPELELEQAGLRADPAALAAYTKVCGFTLRDHLPPTYPHVLAFPLHMAVMADGSFPFGAVGLVHVENRIVQSRPLGSDEELTLRVRPTKLQPHPKGRTFTLVTEARAGEELAWESVSTFLRRGKSSGQAGAEAEGFTTVPTSTLASAEWRLGGDLGRRYAGVSGDRNPIHMHALTAKPLGFPAAIAHGMWTKARCLAALENLLPDAFSVDVRFRKPILLPGEVEFASAAAGEEIAFAVRDARKQSPHLDGRVAPTDPQPKAKTGGTKTR